LAVCGSLELTKVAMRIHGSQENGFKLEEKKNQSQHQQRRRRRRVEEKKEKEPDSSQH